MCLISLVLSAREDPKKDSTHREIDGSPDQGFEFKFRISRGAFIRGSGPTFVFPRRNRGAFLDPNLNTATFPGHKLRVAREISPAPRFSLHASRFLLLQNARPVRDHLYGLRRVETFGAAHAVNVYKIWT
jgi:hypothetical protein